VGVALKLVQALCGRTGRSSLLPAFVKIAAIGTLADVVPLVGENRVIAKLGLGLLSRGPHRVGLRALLDVCGLTGKEIDSYHIGFVLAPRVGSAGRPSTPDAARGCCWRSTKAMWWRCSTPVAPAAGRRSSRRPRRSSRPSWVDRAHLVVAADGWHRGVIGIVASKLVDAFHRPAIVLSIDGDIAHGSCRSIPSFDLLGGLEACEDLLTKFGGHKQAAGLTIETARIREFRSGLNAYADRR
jgi:single-stranded-DNA-specific exonuclease